MRPLLLRMSALFAVALIAACNRADQPRPLATFSTRLDPDLHTQARAVLAQDAWRREHRFREAVSPGYTFASTRVTQRAIDEGSWSAPALYALGAQLFDLTWTRALGYGGRDRPRTVRFHFGRRGGPDATRCAACHWRGGPAGAGDAADNAYLDGDGDTQSSTLGRNPRPLHGAGLIELLGRALSTSLAAQRDALAITARQRGEIVRAPLVAQGVDFGFLTVGPDGVVDTREVRGVDGDLVVRPFGWKGHAASLRDVIEDELLVHHGIESSHLVAEADPARVGPFGGRDPDGDGVIDEVTEGQVTALVLFAAMQEVPQVDTPTHPLDQVRYVDGLQRFTAVGCGGCHTHSLRLEASVYRLASREGRSDFSVDLATHGAEPRVANCTAGVGCEVALYSDLRRHDMGPALAEPRADRGVSGAVFLTPPLWGLARSGPYLHDGRAPTLDDAIRLHGGEALAAREAYMALDEEARGSIRVFLTSLTRARRMIVP